jgi:hypothetical protein
MRRGTTRTLLIVIALSAVAAIIVFSAAFSLFNFGSMFSAIDNSQSGSSGTNEPTNSSPGTNGSMNYTLDDIGFVTWLNETNSNLTTMVKDVRTAGEKYDVNNVTIYFAKIQQFTNRYLMEIGQFNLSSDLKHISEEYQTAMNDIKTGAYYGESAANGTGMEDVSSSITYFSQGSQLASKVMKEVDEIRTSISES